MAAVPPSKLSKRVQCTVGVSQAEPGTCTAFLTWQRPQQQAGGRPALVAEHLGHLHPKPWLAGVAHDVALCSRAFHSGNRTLAGVTHLGGGGASGERLNFPLSSYTSSLSFWDALDKYSFGELALKLRSSRELVKDIFFGDSWEEGLAERRLQQERQRQQAKVQPGGSTRADGTAAAVQPAAAPAPGVGRRQSEQVLAGSKPEAQQGPAGRSPRGSTSSGSEGPLRGGAPPAPTSSKEEPPPPPPLPPQQQGQAKQRQASPHAEGKPQPAAEAIPAGSSSSEVEEQGKPQAAAAASSSDEEEKQVSPRRRQQSQAGVAATAAASPRQRPAAAATAAAPPQASPRRQPRAAAAAPPALAQGTQAAPETAAPAAAVPPTSPHRQSRAATAAAAAASAQAVPAEAAAPAARPGTESEPRVVWARPAEFPQGSGIYPMYMKEGPIARGYFTISHEADGALFGASRHEGDLYLRNPATNRSCIKKAKGSTSEQRYITATKAFNRDNDLSAHDVLWFRTGTPLGKQLQFGVYRWGSQEAAAFRVHLTGGKAAAGQKRRRGAAAAPGQPAPSGGDDGEDDEEEQPLSKRRSKATAEIEDLFEG